eukprot:778905-Rhodomonas_salina.2
MNELRTELEDTPQMRPIEHSSRTGPRLPRPPLRCPTSGPHTDSQPASQTDRQTDTQPAHGPAGAQREGGPGTCSEVQSIGRLVNMFAGHGKTNVSPGHRLASGKDATFHCAHRCVDELLL